MNVFTESEAKLAACHQLKARIAELRVQFTKEPEFNHSIQVDVRTKRLENQLTMSNEQLIIDNE